MKIVFLSFWLLFSCLPFARASDQAILGVGPGTASQVSTNYLGFLDSQSVGFTLVQRECKMSAAGTLSNLRVFLDGSPDNGAGDDNFVFTVLSSGVATAMTCTISETATRCLDTANTYAVSAADQITVEIVPNNFPADRRPAFSINFNSTTDGESVLCGGSSSINLNVVNDTYVGIIGFGQISLTEVITEILMPTSGTIKKLYIKLTLTPLDTPNY